MPTNVWMLLLALASLLPSSANSKDSSVTLLNMKTLFITPGDKLLFLQLCQSWHPDCRDFEPTWEALAKEYKDNNNVMIARLECSVKLHEGLCEHDYRAQAYPALYFGEPLALDRYSGPIDLDSLRTFAADQIKPACSPVKLDLCDEETKNLIQTYRAMSPEELKETMNTVERSISMNENDWVDEETAYREKYVAMRKGYDKKAVGIKEEHHYKWLKALKKLKDEQAAAAAEATADE